MEVLGALVTTSWFLAGFVGPAILFYAAWRMNRNADRTIDATRKAVNHGPAAASGFIALLGGGWSLVDFMGAIICVLFGMLLLLLVGFPFGVSHGWWPSPF